MAVRNYFLLNNTDRKNLDERLSRVLSRWQQEWCAGDSRPLEVELCDTAKADNLSDGEWQHVSTTEGMEACVGLVNQSDNFLSALIGGQVAAGAGNVVAGELKEAAQRALALALLREAKADVARGSVQWSADAPSEEVYAHGEGHVVAHCHSDEIEIIVVLYPPLVSRYVDTGVERAGDVQSSLSTVRAALESERVMLEICAGEAQLMLPELATLTIGDVIRLDRRLEQPALVKLGNGSAYCAGHLGVQGDRKAIQLVSLNDSYEV